MRPNIFLLLVFASFLFLSGCNLLKQDQKADQKSDGKATTQPTGSSTTKTYSHFENPFYAIEYPQGWEERDSGDTVMFLSPRADEFDNYQDNILIQSASAGDASLEEALESYTKGIRSASEEFTIINYSSTTLAGLPAYNLEYKLKTKEQNLQALSVLTLKDKYAYIVTYFALERDYSKYLDDAKHAINSFKIVEYTSDTNITVTEETIPYKNDLYTLDRPENWEVEENDAFTYFKSPSQENQTGLQENVVVYIKELEPADRNLKDFFQNSIYNLMATSPTFMIIDFSEYEYSLGDMPAYRILYSEGEEGSKINYLQVFAVKDNNGYIITYNAPAETFKKYLPEAEAIISSYRLT